MYDRDKLIKTMRLLDGVEIAPIVVYAIAWAAEDEEAQEIFSAKRPSYSFYKRLYEFLKSVGYEKYEEMRVVINYLQLDVQSFEYWIEDIRYEENRTDNSKHGMTE